MDLKRTFKEIGVAFLVAPVVVLIYNILFAQSHIYHIQHHYSIKFILYYIFVYPIMEELIFRGLLQDFLLQKTRYSVLIWKITMANVLTSFVFMSVHFIYNTPIWAILVFFPSLIFGYFYENYEKYYLNIFLHIFYNFCSLFFLL